MSAKYYVEAYYEDGGQILGNCDGQAVLRCRNFRRTKYYKYLRDKVSRGAQPKRVSYYKIVAENGNVLETII
jgi:hypothetical protein